MAGKVTVGLASHCMVMRHRLSGIPTYGLNGLGKGDDASTPPKLHSEYYDDFTFTLW